MAFFQKNSSAYQIYYEVRFFDNIYYSAHFHPNIEFIFVLDGKLEIYDEEKLFTLNSGEGALILPNHIHSFQKDNNSKCLVCSFSSDYVPSFYSKIKNKTADDIRFTPEKTVIDFLLCQFNKREVLSVFEIKSIAYTICASFFNSVTLKDTDGNSDIMHAMLSYLTENFNKDITLKEMAKNLGYEEHYLSRRFHKNFPFNFKDYVNQLRVNQAKILLEQTNQSITDIAYNCGFTSVRNFNRAFKSVSDVTPREYRLNFNKSSSK